MIDGVEIKELKVFKDERGWLMEMLRSDDKIFQKFGQSYVTVCNPGYVKAWHYHKKQSDFMTVVKGKAKIVLYDIRDNSPTKGKVQEILIDENNRMLIKIPPMVVHGLAAMDEEPCFFVNFPTEAYNRDHPDEERLPADSKEVPYSWGDRKGW